MCIANVWNAFYRILFAISQFKKKKHALSGYSRRRYISVFWVDRLFAMHLMCPEFPHPSAHMILSQEIHTQIVCRWMVIVQHSRESSAHKFITPIIYWCACLNRHTKPKTEIYTHTPAEPREKSQKHKQINKMTKSLLKLKCESSLINNARVTCDNLCVLRNQWGSTGKSEGKENKQKNTHTEQRLQQQKRLRIS